MDPFHTRASLAQDLENLGISAGDIVMVHAAVSRIGSILGGPDALIGAIRDAVGPAGTICAYTDWDGNYEDLLDPGGAVPERWRGHIPPYDRQASRAIRDNGVFAEFLRTTPGAVRSANPGASVAAIGARADWLVAGHAVDYGYGEASPFAKLAAAGGKVAMLGAPLDTMTILHHAEHLADIPGKRIKRVEVPFTSETGVQWRWCEEFDTAQAVVPALDGEDYFTAIAEAFLAAGNGARGRVGAAPCVVVEAGPIVRFAVSWLERRIRGGLPSPRREEDGSPKGRDR